MISGSELRAYVDREKLPDEEESEQLHHNPSKIADCVRMQWYRWTGTEKDPETGGFSYADFGQGRGAVGNIFEGLIINWFKQAKLWRGEQIYATSRRYNISGRIDLKFAWQEKTWLGEIKSIKFDGYEWALRRPNESNVWQLMAYLWLKEQRHGGYLFYITLSPDGQVLWSPVFVPYDEVLIARIQRTLNDLNVAIATEQIPPRAPVGYWQCGKVKATGHRICPYWDRCMNRDGP